MVEYSVTDAKYCPESVHGETHLTICHSMSLNMILTVAELKNNSPKTYIGLNMKLPWLT